jgi:hypothetical protein
MAQGKRRIVRGASSARSRCWSAAPPPSSARKLLALAEKVHPLLHITMCAFGAPFRYSTIIEIVS